MSTFNLLYPAFQKFYSALNSLNRFSKEKNFFDNISSLDTFFSEFRNVTFVLQKSLANTQYISVYEKNRDKYLSEFRWFVEKRNEITKEHPFRLYVPGGAGHVKRIIHENNLEEVLKATLEIVSGCNCGEKEGGTSCYGCLRNYSNQFCHDILDRNKVKEFIEELLSH